MGAQIGAPRPKTEEAAPVFPWKDDYIRRASSYLKASSAHLDTLFGRPGDASSPGQLVPLMTYLEPRFTPLRNAIPRQAAHGNAVEFRPESNYGLSAGFSPDGRFANGFRLTEVSLVPAENAFFGPIQFRDPVLEPYIQRTSDQLLRIIRGEEEGILFASPASRIEVVSQPAIYDPSSPDRWRAYVRQLRQQGLSADAIARWCPALAWSQIVEVLG